MAVTVTDVARAAGVSVSTVSYALSGSRKISEKTRGRVFEAVDRLGYTPNQLARGLRGGRSRILALLYPMDDDVLDPSGLDYVLGASTRAQSLGYHMLLDTTEVPGLDELRQLARRGLVDGAVLMQVSLRDARPQVLTEAGIPFVLIGRIAGPPPGDSVDLDGELAGRVAVAHLGDLGHRVTAMIGQPGPQIGRSFGVALRAQEGAVAEAAARGMELLMVSCRHSHASGYAAFSQLIEENPEITGLVVQNEPALGGILTAAADAGRSVPGDLSLISVGMGTIAAELHNPPITTVSVSGRRLGEMAVDNLIRRLEGDESEPREDVFAGDLVVRRSTGRAPVAG